jgi:hypothetical protein
MRTNAFRPTLRPTSAARASRRGARCLRVVHPRHTCAERARARTLRAGRLEVLQFSHGQSNPTFLLKSASGAKARARVDAAPRHVRRRALTRRRCAVRPAQEAAGKAAPVSTSGRARVPRHQGSGGALRVSASLCSSIVAGPAAGRAGPPPEHARLPQATRVPVPRAYCLCEDSSVIGTPFYVMQFVEGRVFKDPALMGAPCRAAPCRPFIR